MHNDNGENEKLYKELEEPCKSLIDKGKCLGCQALENPEFKGNKNCIYAKIPTAADSIRQIHKNLGGERK